jgi:mannan endo-1,4-beta-mannosidase
MLRRALSVAVVTALIVPSAAGAVRLGISGTPAQYATLRADGLPLTNLASWTSFGTSSTRLGVILAETPAGAEPMVNWEPNGSTMPSIAVGENDAYIESWARVVAAYKRPVSIRFAHEMNGTWYAWHATGPAAYVAAWRRVVTVFRRVGATNAVFVWSPDGLIGEHQGPWERGVAQWYPGAAYVNEVGMTTYATASNIRFGLKAWMSRVDWLHVRYRKPMVLPEMKVLFRSRYPWLRELAPALAARPWIKAVIWSESPTDQSGTPGFGNINWLLENDPKARKLLRQAVAR